MGIKRRTFAVLDCESDPFAAGRVPVPFLWGFYDGQNYEEYGYLNSIPAGVDVTGIRDYSVMIRDLSERNIVVYAHNGGKFDYHFMLDDLEPFEPVTIINGRLAKFKIGECEFRDSFNIMPVSLATYEKSHIDYSLMEIGARYKPAAWREIRAYLYSDCINQYNMVRAFIDRHGMQITQASASMKSWQKQTKRKAPHTDEQYYEKFYPYYFGGRVQCFQSGIINSDFAVVDINSAYPFAMLSEHPIGTVYNSIDGAPDMPRDAWGPMLFTVECVSRGAFPFRADDKSLRFPADDVRRIYHVTGWELVAALDTGTISDYEILNTLSFPELIDFRDYILPLYDERKAAKASGDKATDLLAKLGMNSLYGKFAADPRNYKEFMVVDVEHIAALEDDPEYNFNGLLGPWALAAKPIHDERMRFYNVATAASITGYVRAMLWRALCQCDGVMYCDTDSITANNISAIDLGQELGQWSLDGEFDQAAIGGKKLYAYHYKPGKEPIKKDRQGKEFKEKWKIASKGTKLTAAQIVQVCKGHTITYDPEVPTFSVHHAPRFTPRRVKMTIK
jgi:hypothetical protein